MTFAGDGLGAIYSEIRAVATRLDRDPHTAGTGQALKDTAEAALREVMDRWRAQNTTTTTTRGRERPGPPYARRDAPTRARENHNQSPLGRG